MTEGLESDTMPPTQIDINDTIILNGHPDRYQVTGWDFDPEDPDVDTITYIVIWLGQTGPGTQIDMNSMIYNDNQPAHVYKVVGWDYNSASPNVETLTFNVEYQD